MQLESRGRVTTERLSLRSEISCSDASRVDLASRSSFQSCTCALLVRVHEHAGSGATHLSLVAHHPLSIDMLPHGLYVTRVPPIGVVLALC